MELTEARPRALVCKLVDFTGVWMYMGTTTQLHPHGRFAFFAKGLRFPIMVTTHADHEKCDTQYAWRVDKHLENGFELVWQTEVPISVMRAVGLNAYAGDWADSVLRVASKKMEPEFAW